ncbi:MAG TPA: RES family NAD+ phosphorylase [Rhizomicrobium sp.]|jgi:RES domain-containing protein
MRLWRLSSERRARDFDGGFGISNDGRWNTRGRAVTYCATVASLAALEKRVHVIDPALLPPQVLIVYEMPDSLSRREFAIDRLPSNWTAKETHTQAIGDHWLDSKTEVLLFVPSAVMPFTGIPDRNVLINHGVADAASVKIVEAISFTFDPRLFAPRR